MIFKGLNRVFFNKLNPRCMELLGQVVWSINVQFNLDTSLDEAIELSSRGLDDGFTGAMIIMPRDNDRPNWISFFRYLHHVMQRNQNT